MNRKIKVLHVAPQPPPLGGMVTYIQGLLNSDVFKVVDYDIVRANFFNKESYTGIIRFFMNIFNAIILSTVFLAKTIFWNPDIVHIQSNSGFGYFEKSWITLLAKMFRKKTVLHFHGGNFLNFYNESPKLKKIIIQKSALLNDRLITGSPQMRDNWLRVGIPENKIKYIGNAVDLPDIVGKENHKTLIVLFLTRIVIAKGIIELIDAFLDLRENYPNTMLRIVGAESLESPLIIEYLRNKDKNGYIDYVGPVSEEQKHLEYMSADIFAFPTYVEDQSYAIMEAMSYGLSCVASNVGGVPSLIKNMENGVLVNPKDVKSLIQGLKILYDDIQLRKSISNAARKTIEDGFTWKKRSSDIIALYNDVINFQKPT
jgi:glycosyltransferase involved in cell wall biosynthesis